jgi:hypothetical protein
MYPSCTLPPHCSLLGIFHSCFLNKGVLPLMPDHRSLTSRACFCPPLHIAPLTPPGTLLHFLAIGFLQCSDVQTPFADPASSMRLTSYLHFGAHCDDARDDPLPCPWCLLFVWLKSPLSCPFLVALLPHFTPLFLDRRFSDRLLTTGDKTRRRKATGSKKGDAKGRGKNPNMESDTV